MDNQKKYWVPGVGHLYKGETLLEYAKRNTKETLSLMEKMDIKVSTTRGATE